MAAAAALSYTQLNKIVLIYQSPVYMCTHNLSQVGIDRTNTILALDLTTEFYKIWPIYSPQKCQIARILVKCLQAAHMNS